MEWAGVIMAKKIKLVFLTVSLQGGGAERFIATLANSLDKEKFDITVLSYTSEKVYLLDGAVKFKTILPDALLSVRKFYSKILGLIGEKQNGIKSNGKKQGGGGKLHSTFILRRFVFWKYFFFLKIERPDVVFSILPAANFLSVSSSKYSKHATIVCEGVFPSTHSEIYFPFVRSYAMADVIVAKSELMKNSLCRDFGLPLEKIILLYNPVDLEKVNKLSKERVFGDLFAEKGLPVIIACGRLHVQKGFDVLIKAFSEVRKKLKCKLVILGDGLEKNSLVCLAEKLGVLDSIEFAGWQDNPFKFVAKADVFVLSSRFEGLPNALLEAMALGKACVSTDCNSGPAEIITDNKNGLLVPVGDEKRLAEAIIKVLKNKKLKSKLEKNAKIRASDFDSKKIIKQFEKLFIETVHKKNARL